MGVDSVVDLAVEAAAGLRLGGKKKGEEKRLEKDREYFISLLVPAEAGLE